MLPRKLSILDEHNLISHLQSLQGDDRRLRFGGYASDEYIAQYVNKSLNDVDSKWFGIDQIDGHIVAACHAAITGNVAELGCSVDSSHRGHGYAQEMFDRAVTWLRTKGILDVCMHCLSENLVMKHIARKNDMVVVSEDGEADAVVHLDPPTPVVHMVDAYADRMALYDMLYKNNISAMRAFVPKYWYESQSN